jgi:sialate O-acetylesterase
MFKSNPSLASVTDRWQEGLKTYSQDIQAYKAKLARWNRLAKQAKDANSEFKLPRPKGPAYDPNSASRPSVLFNGMINPLIPYTFKGVIWYQGESNAPYACEYRTLFPAMITDWRNHWHQGDFEFIFVQLANYTAVGSLPASWAELREAQAMTLSLKNTGMAVIVDIGEPNNIHPRNKQEVARRLMLPALANVYDRNIEYSGPMYKSSKAADSKMLIIFDHAKGLVAKGGTLKEFQVAGQDKKFVDANAVIIGDNKIEVSSPNVSKPVAVRYGWSNNPEKCNLYNTAGLPASPFRTDDWPCVTK